MQDQVQESVPDAERGDWIAFLHFMADEKNMSATDLIYVVEKPEKHGAEYKEFLIHTAEENAAE